MSNILGLAWKAEQAMSLMTAQGLTTRAIQLGLQALGLGIRRQKITDYVRLVRGASDRSIAVAGSIGSNEIPREAMTEMTLSKPTKYRVYGNQLVENVETGETHKRPASMFTNQNQDALDYESDFLDENEENPSDPNFRVVGFEVLDVYHNRGYSY